jgi:hypothetical protein
MCADLLYVGAGLLAKLLILPLPLPLPLRLRLRLRLRLPLLWLQICRPFPGAMPE